MRRLGLIALAAGLLTANTGCQQNSSNPSGSSSLLNSSGGSGGGFWQALAQGLQGLASGASGTSGTRASSSGGFTSQTQGGANPSGWQRIFGPARNNRGSGGTPFGESGNSNIQPNGKVFNVICSSFGPQTIAGKSWEDGSSRYEKGERGASLPSRRGLSLYIGVRYNGHVAYAKVIDVGPWSTKDPYWEGSGTPQAEGAQGTTRIGTLDSNSAGNLTRQSLKVNGAGLDLTHQTWADLGVNTSSVLDRVEWWVVSQAEADQWLARQATSTRAYMASSGSGNRQPGSA